MSPGPKSRIPSCASTAGPRPSHTSINHTYQNHARLQGERVVPYSRGFGGQKTSKRRTLVCLHALSLCAPLLFDRANPHQTPYPHTIDASDRFCASRCWRARWQRQVRERACAAAAAASLAAACAPRGLRSSPQKTSTDRFIAPDIRVRIYTPQHTHTLIHYHSGAEGRARGRAQGRGAKGRGGGQGRRRQARRRARRRAAGADGAVRVPAPRGRRRLLRQGPGVRQGRLRLPQRVRVHAQGQAVVRDALHVPQDGQDPRDDAADVHAHARPARAGGALLQVHAQGPQARERRRPRRLFDVLTY